MQTHRQGTVVALLVDRVHQQPDHPAIYRKRNDEFQSLSWRDVARDAARMTLLLSQLGVSDGDRVVVLSENRYEWIVADLGILLAGAVHVPIHATLTGPQIAYQIADCAAKVVLLSNDVQAAKLFSQRHRLPADVELIAFEECQTELPGRPITPLVEALTSITGDPWEQVHQTALAAVRPDSLATILYTSGTTGEPKGVMLTQSNLASNTVAAIESFADDTAQLRINFLPLSHIFARTCDLYVTIASPSALAIAGSGETVIADCATLQPTWLNGVPYFYEKIYRHLQESNLLEVPGVVQQVLGGSMQHLCGGGAALASHVSSFFARQGLPILQGYGLTETSPVITTSTPAHWRHGSSGKTIPGVDVKINDDGEILTRGPHVMSGYFRNEAATSEVMQGEWFMTGDLGRIDDDGFLFITGRKKEIIVTSAGKNIAPVYLESVLTQDPWIAQAMVVGDDRNYLTALIVPDVAQLNESLSVEGIELDSIENWLQDSSVIQRYQQHIERLLSEVSHHEQVRRFRLLAEPFTIENGQLTPKLTLRRDQIHARYQNEIDQLYQ